MQARITRWKTVLIRSVQVTPESIIFLSTEQQLKDIERFCTNPEMFCVLGIDANFELCDYHMTIATYHNPMLKKKVEILLLLLVQEYYTKLYSNAHTRYLELKWWDGTHHVQVFWFLESMGN